MQLELELRDKEVETPMNRCKVQKLGDVAVVFLFVERAVL